jgi:signal transduction histidine kinase
MHYLSNKIINDLIDYARDMQLELETSSISNVLIKALGMVKIPSNVKVITTLPEELILRIEKKLEQAFIHLIKNAIDVMPNGGTISIECKRLDGNC